MQHEFQIHHAGNLYWTTGFTFPGGEIQLSSSDLPDNLTGEVTVVARLQSADALVKLLLLDELLGRVHREGRRTLVAPYFPYARQDRVMQPREAFSLKAVARLVNSLGFDEVVTCDPHSDVTPALVENIRAVSQVDLVEGHPELASFLCRSRPVVVSPDAGAAKKAFAVAQRFSLPMLTASKIRDTSCPFREVHLQSRGEGRQAGAIAMKGGCDGQHTARCDEGSLLAGRRPAAGRQRAVGAGVLSAERARRAVVL